MSENKLENLQTKVMQIAGKIQNNVIVSAITQGMMSTMGVLMGAAIVNIIINLPIDAWKNFLDSIGLLKPLTDVVTIANMIGIFMSFGIGRALGQKKGVDGVEAGIAALFCYLLVTPISLTEAGGEAIETGLLGAQGVITAMIVSVCSVLLFAKLNQPRFKIKMPDSVPKFVSDTFVNLPSQLITILPFIALRVIFGATQYGCFTNFINQTLQAPLTSVGNTLGGQMLLLFVACFLWWLGLHGTLIIYPAIMVVCYAPLLENIAAVNAGQPAPHLLSMMTLFSVIQILGGPGCLFGLFVDMAFFSKSERYKAQGRLQLVPGLFNIIEPAVYGMPIVLNFVLLIPFVLFPQVVMVLLYLGLKAGLFTTPLMMPSSFLPGPIQGFLMGGGVGFGIWVIAMCILSCIVYYPFVKIMDNQALKEESAE